MSREAVQLTSEMMTRMAGLFPRTWARAFPDDRVLALAKREVAQELNGWPILPTRAVIERAVGEIKRAGERWPPSVPELLSYLRPRPSDFGLPDLDAAWREACSQSAYPERARWSHPAVRVAGRMTGWFELSTASSASVLRRVEQRFQRHYEAVCNRILAGGDIEGQQLLESHSTPAQRAEYQSDECMRQRIEEQGLPQRMTADQAFAMMGLLYENTALCDGGSHD